MNDEKIELYLKEIVEYQKKIDKVHEEQKVERIYLLSKQLVFIGRLASNFAGRYKRLYNTRKQVHAEEYINAKRFRAATAELAIVEIRAQEAEAYEYFKRWTNAFESTREEINALKYKVRIDLADGSSSNNF